MKAFLLLLFGSVGIYLSAQYFNTDKTALAKFMRRMYSSSPTAKRNSKIILEFKEFLNNNPQGTFDGFRITRYRMKLPSIQGE